VEDIAALRARINSHDPQLCETCGEYAQQRWRQTYAKSIRSDAPRWPALLSHVTSYASRAGKPAEALSELDEFVGRGTKHLGDLPNTQKDAAAETVPKELMEAVALLDGRDSPGIPELEIPYDLDVRPDHDETTCPVCVYWARACVYSLENIGRLEQIWVKRRPDDHIAADATDDQRAFWRESFEHTSRVIEHVLTVRPKDEDALTWHGRVLRATAPDDEVAMHNLRWSELDDRRERHLDLSAAHKADLKKRPHTYPDGVPAIGGGYSPWGNSMLIKWLQSYGLGWAPGTRFPENLPVELIRRVPAFMRKP
jgi:hypothetical protein